MHKVMQATAMKRIQQEVHTASHFVVAIITCSNQSRKILTTQFKNSRTDGSQNQTDNNKDGQLEDGNALPKFVPPKLTFILKGKATP